MTSTDERVPLLVTRSVSVESRSWRKRPVVIVSLATMGVAFCLAVAVPLAFHAAKPAPETGAVEVLKQDSSHTYLAESLPHQAQPARIDRCPTPADIPSFDPEALASGVWHEVGAVRSTSYPKFQCSCATLKFFVTAKDEQLNANISYALSCREDDEVELYTGSLLSTGTPGKWTQATVREPVFWSVVNQSANYSVLYECRERTGWSGVPHSASYSAHFLFRQRSADQSTLNQLLSEINSEKLNPENALLTMVDHTRCFQHQPLPNRQQDQTPSIVPAAGVKPARFHSAESRHHSAESRERASHESREFKLSHLQHDQMPSIAPASGVEEAAPAPLYDSAESKEWKSKEKESRESSEFKLSQFMQETNVLHDYKAAYEVMSKQKAVNSKRLDERCIERAIPPSYNLDAFASTFWYEVAKIESPGADRLYHRCVCTTFDFNTDSQGPPTIISTTVTTITRLIGKVTTSITPAATTSPTVAKDQSTTVTSSDHAEKKVTTSSGVLGSKMTTTGMKSTSATVVSGGKTVTPGVKPHWVESGETGGTALYSCRRRRPDGAVERAELKFEATGIEGKWLQRDERKNITWSVVMQDADFVVLYDCNVVRGSILRDIVHYGLRILSSSPEVSQARVRRLIDYLNREGLNPEEWEPDYISHEGCLY